MLRRLLSLGPWLTELKGIWLALAIVVIALAFCLSPGTTEPRIRITGLVLQVLGVATAVWGILETRRFFGLRSPLAALRSWISRCPLRGVTLRAGVGVASSRESAAEEPVEVRLAALEKNINHIHERISSLAKDLDRDIYELNERVHREGEERTRVSAQLHGRIQAVSTGGLHTIAVGAAWLFVGVVLSTAAPEFAALLR